MNKWILKYLGERLPGGCQEAPTLEEIRKITKYPDRRIKPTIYLMASSGIRLGAFDFRKWGETEPIMKNGSLLAAKIRVYSDEERALWAQGLRKELAKGKRRHESKLTMALENGSRQDAKLEE